jgi:anti-sigma regulatory factor (Ser/Thr protein kinase)
MVPQFLSSAGDSGTREVRVEDASQAGEARRRCAALSRQIGLDEPTTEDAAIAATELATNLVKHAGGGFLLLRPLAWADRRGIELLSLDRGGGMKNVARCLRDGYSTSGSPGTGLGAVQRLSAQFDLYTQPDAGTAILSRFWCGGGQTAARPSIPLDVGAVCLPYRPGEPCGDAWALAAFPGRVVLLVADGLGHGPGAALAANTAVRLFGKHAEHDGPTIVAALHAGLDGTRGGAIAVAELDTARRRLRYTGLGNIAGRIMGGKAAQHLVSSNGTAGVAAPRFQEFDYVWPDGGTLVMHSDGLVSHWDGDRYPALAERSPAVIAGMLYRDHVRGRDDVTVLAVKEARKP